MPKDLTKRPGIKYIHAFPKTEPIVGMVHHNGRLVIATVRRLYELKPKYTNGFKLGEVLEPIKIEWSET